VDEENAIVRGLQHCRAFQGWENISVSNSEKSFGIRNQVSSYADSVIDALWAF
jgi:hypothetical protein